MVKWWKGENERENKAERAKEATRTVTRQAKSAVSTARLELDRALRELAAAKAKAREQ